MVTSFCVYHQRFLDSSKHNNLNILIKKHFFYKKIVYYTLGHISKKPARLVDLWTFYRIFLIYHDVPFLKQKQLVITSIMRKFVQAHFTPFPTNVSDTVPCSFHRLIYANRLCSKTILSIRRAATTPSTIMDLKLQNKNLKITMLSQRNGEMIFEFICLDKLVREGTNKQLPFPNFFLLFYKLT